MQDEAAISHSPEFVAIVAAADEGLLAANETFLKSFSLEDQSGTRRFTEWIHPEDQQIFHNALAHALGPSGLACVRCRLLGAGAGVSLVDWFIKAAPEGGYALLYGLKPDAAPAELDLASLRRRQSPAQVVVGGDEATRRHAREDAEARVQLAAVLANMVEGVVIFDAQGNLLDMNPAALEMHGSKDINPLRVSLADLEKSFILHDMKGRQLPPDQWPIARTLRGESFRGMKVRVDRTDGGKDSWVGSYGGMPVRGDGGRIILLIVTMRDITDEQRAEEALRVSEERLRQAVEVAGIGIFEHDYTDDWFECSPTYRSIWGFQPDQKIGFEEFLKKTFPEDRAMVAAAMEAARDAAGNGLYRVEHRIVHPDGSIRWINERAGTFFAGEGADRRAVRTIGACTDITERKQAEEALCASEERLRQAVLLTGIGIFEHDHISGAIDFSSILRRIYALPEADPISMDEFVARFHPAERDKILAAIAAAHDPAGDGAYSREHRIVLPDGSERWVSVQSQTFFAGEGAQRRAIRTIGACADITARRESEEALHRSRDELEQLVAVRTAQLSQRAMQLAQLASELTLAEQRERRRLAQVIHDHLQQLLVAAKFGLESLIRRAGTECKSGIAQIHELLSQSIDISRSLTVELSPPILHEAGLEAALEWLARWFRDKYEMEVELELATCEKNLADDINVLLFQAVRELLLNVAKHSGVNSARVRVASAQPKLIALQVIDEGRGFNAGQFSHGENSGGGGYGLLSIRERLALLGGELQIESTPAKGTVVTLVAPLRLKGDAPVAIPLSPVSPAGAGAATDEPAEATPSALRVLLVDDHHVVRQGLATLLAEEPDIMVVGEAVDGLDGVVQARCLRPDVILMDFSMPIMDGVEATRIIHEELPQTRILGLSMYSEPDRAAAMLAAGASGYASKSGNLNDLLRLIRAGRP